MTHSCNIIRLYFTVGEPVFWKISLLEHFCLPQCLNKRIMFGAGWRDLESGLFSTGSCLIVLTRGFFCCCFHWSLSHSCSCGRRCIILHLNFCKFLKGVGINLPVSLNLLRSDTLKGHFTQNELKSSAFYARYWSSNIIPLLSLQANVNILFCMKILHVSACEPRRQGQGKA